MSPQRDREPLYTPSEADIEQQCRVIRQGWSVREERKRRRWTGVQPLLVTLIPACNWLTDGAAERLLTE